MSEYDATISGYYTSDGNARIITMPFQPDWMEVRLQGSASGDVWESTASPGVVKEAYYYKGMASNSALTTKNTNSAATDTKDFLSTGGFTPFTSDSDLKGAAQIGTAITAATPAAVTLNGHGYSNGDVVLLTVTTGMLQIAGLPFTLNNVSTNNFDLAYLAAAGFAAPATAVTAQKIIYPAVFTPQLRFITAVTRGATTTIQFSVTHGYAVDMNLRFRMPAEFGMVELDGLNGKILSVNTTTNTVVVDIDSSSFTAFAFPTSAVAANGMSFPQAVPNGTPENDVPAATYVNNSARGMVLGSAIVGGNTALVFWKAGLSNYVDNGS